MADVDLNLDVLTELLALVEGLGESYVEAGIQGDEGSEIIVRAATNEFGSEDGHVPERSFIRSTAKAQEDAWGKLANNAAAAALKPGGGGTEQALGLLGTVMQGDIRQAIVDIKDPPNADSTIRRKKSDNPLVDSGRMRSAVTYKVVTK